jgi:hypothetical protein
MQHLRGQKYKRVGDCGGFTGTWRQEGCACKMQTRIQRPRIYASKLGVEVACGAQGSAVSSIWSSVETTALGSMDQSTHTSIHQSINHPKSPLS